MISGIYIADCQGEVIIERTYIIPPPRETVKKFIVSELSKGTSETWSGIGNEIVWEKDQYYIFAIRRDQVYIIALTQGDVSYFLM